MFVQPAGRLAWHFFFIPAMLRSIGTIDFYHVIPLSLSLPGGHKVRAKQNLFGFI